MEQGGKLINWNDAKGFGFIQPDDGSDRVFAHISVMRGDARPVAGMAVRFVGSRDAQGRLRAEHMRGTGLALDRPAIRRKPQAARGSNGKTSTKPAPRRQAAPSRPAQPVRHAGLKLGILALLCALPLAGTERHADAVMTNIIGHEVDDWLAPLSDPAARLHLYGKARARPGRKMGHLTRLYPRAL